MGIVLRRRRHHSRIVIEAGGSQGGQNPYRSKTIRVVSMTVDMGERVVEY